MEIFLFFAYLLMLMLHIANLIFRIRHNNGWCLTFASQIICMFIALIVAAYFDRKPGYGYMPGLTYMGGVLFSYAALIAFFTIFLIGITAFILIRRKNFSKKS